MLSELEKVLLDAGICYECDRMIGEGRLCVTCAAYKSHKERFYYTLTIHDTSPSIQFRLPSLDMLLRTITENKHRRIVSASREWVGLTESEQTIVSEYLFRSKGYGSTE